jgi:hypothetical protein
VTLNFKTRRRGCPATFYVTTALRALLAVHHA